ncbi:hypothetical protein BJV78DRAFT_1353572 [Lactifluus subvellereus]|nr:hypothetical protein BJV78DRAFT_1353572 [Lactifluus subvellereus]
MAWMPKFRSKGAQALRMRGGFCVCHLATGDILCEQVVKKAPLSVEAKKMPLENNKVCKNGFPCTVPQAEKLDAMVTLCKGSVTGEPLIQHSNDDVEALMKRLGVFYSTRRVADGPGHQLLQKEGTLVPIDAAQAPPVVWDKDSARCSPSSSIQKGSDRPLGI